MSKLEDKLLTKGQQEVARIEMAARQEAESVYGDLIGKAQAKINLRRQKVEDGFKHDLARAQLEAERIIKEETLLVKQNLMEQVFREVEEYLISLKGPQLFDYIVHKLSVEKITGHEIIAVNKLDYAKYHDVLTEAKGDLVECNLLNAKLKTQLKLTKKPVDLENGFLLIGTEYDLNFSFKEVIARLVNKYEKQIYEDLK